jgi:hypothetical protein
MKIFNYFKTRHTFLKDNGYTQGWQLEEHRRFGKMIWLNAVELLTDLCNDVMFVYEGKELNKFAEFKIFFSSQAEIVLHRYFSNGYCVIAYTGMAFKILNENEYRVISRCGAQKIEATNPKYTVYVMRSPVYCELGLSDRELAKPALELIDNALNASNTCSARLGTLVVATPSTPNAVPTPLVLTEQQKKDLEDELSKEYGGLSNQKQLMILKRGMNFQTISLAGIDARTAEKVRLGVCMVADRLKIPANQIAILDANSNKTLANGSELREGDFNKYQTFERLLNRTFVQMALDCGMKVDYLIYNKPVRGGQSNS